MGLAGVAAMWAGPTFAQVGAEGLTPQRGELQNAGGPDVRGQEALAAQARFATAGGRSAGE